MVLPMVTSPRTVSRLTRTPRTERSAAVGMPRQAVVELPDGTTSWAGCTGGPSGLGALVARPGWVHWWPVRAGCTGGPSGLGAPVARPGWVHRWPRPAALSSVDRVRQG